VWEGPCGACAFAGCYMGRSKRAHAGKRALDTHATTRAHVAPTFALTATRTTDSCKATLRHCARSEPPVAQSKGVYGDVRTAVGLSRGSLVENAPAKGSTAKPAPSGSLTGAAGVDGSVSLLRSRSLPAPHACIWMQLNVSGWFVRRFPCTVLVNPKAISATKQRTTSQPRW
jgi:hypothetical protein